MNLTQEIPCGLDTRTSRAQTAHGMMPPREPDHWQHVLVLADRAEATGALAVDEIKLLGLALLQAYDQAAERATFLDAANNHRQVLVQELAAMDEQRQLELEGRTEAVRLACLAQGQLAEQRRLVSELSAQLARSNARLQELEPGRRLPVVELPARSIGADR